MSDSALVLVARVESPAATAARLLAHLAGAGIIEALPTDSALGSLGHRPGPRVLDAVVKLGSDIADFRTLRTNGVEVSLSRLPRFLSITTRCRSSAAPAAARRWTASA